MMHAGSSQPELAGSADPRWLQRDDDRSGQVNADPISVRVGETRKTEQSLNEVLAAIKCKHVARAAAPAEHVFLLHVVTKSVPCKEVTPQCIGCV